MRIKKQFQIRFNANKEPLMTTPSQLSRVDQNNVHLISILVENRSGVLAHISGMFSARGYNISSLAVGETLDPTVSRITIAAPGDEGVINQIISQLGKLVDVIRVVNISKKEHVERELLLVKVQTTPSTRAQIIELTEIFRARIVDVHMESLTIEVVGKQGKINALIDLFRPFGILEIARTGRIATLRGKEILKISTNPPKEEDRSQRSS